MDTTLGGMRGGLLAAFCCVLGCSGGGSGVTDAGEDGGARDAAEEAGEGGGDFCPANGFRCEGERVVPCSADAAVESQDCAADGQRCDSARGCVECRAGEQSCSDGVATWCNDDGELVVYDCDPMQGLSCEPGGCRGECAAPSVADSYIGCDYYPTVTLNPVWSGFDYAVAVSNAADSDTHVTLTRGEAMIEEADLEAGELRVISLPWVSELKGGDVDACQQPPAAGATRLVADGAYRVRSDQPVTVYQFSPLDYELDPAPEGCPVNADCPGAPDDAIADCLSYSNDASLLLPATALTGNYTVLSWPAWSLGAGFASITAVEDGTEVRLIGAGAVAEGAGIDGQGNGSVRLDRGDVLQVVSAPHSGSGYGADLSGTRVRADKPVQVIGGSSCAQLPQADTGTCDHLEQALVPEDTLGSEYVATVPDYVDGQTPSPFVLRIAAIRADTDVHFEPAIVADLTLSPEDGPYEIQVEGDQLSDIHITGEAPLLVAQYLPGQDALPVSGIVGDPSMSLLPPVEQYRREYLFTAPQSFIANFVNIVAPEGVSVRLDGSTLDPGEFTPLPSSDYGVARVRLTGDRSSHTLEADREVGLVVYGYGLFTSYMYPGGMDLQRITIPPLI